MYAEFGCEDAFFSNIRSNKRLEDLFFKGYFTTGDSGRLSTMEFGLLDFNTSKQDFQRKLKSKELRVTRNRYAATLDFELDFLADFKITILKT